MYENPGARGVLIGLFTRTRLQYPVPGTMHEMYGTLDEFNIHTTQRPVKTPPNIKRNKRQRCFLMKRGNIIFYKKGGKKSTLVRILSVLVLP